MSSMPGRSVRRRRAVPRGPVVAVTGAASPLGALVVERLVAHTAAADPGSHLVGSGGGEPSIGAVLALDTERGATQGAQWRIGPLDDPSVADRLRGADVVVLLAPDADLGAALAKAPSDRREQIVRYAQAVTTSAAAVGSRRLVAVTSAMVLGSDANNPVPLPDDAPVSAVSDLGVVGDLLEVEQVLSRVPRTHPGVTVTVLRPAALVGPTVDTLITRHFEAPRLLVLREGRMVFQFCHVDDLAEAVAVAVLAGLEGSLTVGSEGVLTQTEVERLSGMRRVELPASLAFATAERLHRLGVLPTPAAELGYVVHPWAVSSVRLREAGWRPAFDNEACLAVLLEAVRGHHALASRRLDRKEAALGAAGAAVALVGTAALVRRRRRREAGP